jgi:hypothetical protein
VVRRAFTEASIVPTRFTEPTVEPFFYCDQILWASHGDQEPFCFFLSATRATALIAVDDSCWSQDDYEQTVDFRLSRKKADSRHMVLRYRTAKRVGAIATGGNQHVKNEAGERGSSAAGAPG